MSEIFLKGRIEGLKYQKLKHVDWLLKPIGWKSVARKEIFQKVKEIPLTPMGVLAPVSAHVGLSTQPPIDVSGNFPAHSSAELPSNISPNPLEVISEISELHNISF